MNSTKNHLKRLQTALWKSKPGRLLLTEKINVSAAVEHFPVRLYNQVSVSNLQCVKFGYVSISVVVLTVDTTETPSVEKTNMATLKSQIKKKKKI